MYFLVRFAFFIVFCRISGKLCNTFICITFIHTQSTLYIFLRSFKVDQEISNFTHKLRKLKVRKQIPKYFINLYSSFIDVFSICLSTYQLKDFNKNKLHNTYLHNLFKSFIFKCLTNTPAA